MSTFKFDYPIVEDLSFFDSPNSVHLLLSKEMSSSWYLACTYVWNKSYNTFHVFVFTKHTHGTYNTLDDFHRCIICSKNVGCQMILRCTRLSMQLTPNLCIHFSTIYFPEAIEVPDEVQHVPFFTHRAPYSCSSSSHRMLIPTKCDCRQRSAKEVTLYMCISIYVCPIGSACMITMFIKNYVVIARSPPTYHSRHVCPKPYRVAIAVRTADGKATRGWHMSNIGRSGRIMTKSSMTGVNASQASSYPLKSIYVNKIASLTTKYIVEFFIYFWVIFEYLYS